MIPENMDKVCLELEPLTGKIRADCRFNFIIFWLAAVISAVLLFGPTGQHFYWAVARWINGGYGTLAHWSVWWPILVVVAIWILWLCLRRNIGEVACIYQHKVNETILKNNLFPNIDYIDPDSGINEGVLNSFELYGPADYYVSSGGLSGHCGEAEFVASHVVLKMDVPIDDRGATVPVTVFSGYVMIMEANKSFKYSTQVLEDTMESLFGSLVGNVLQKMNFGNLVKMEDPEFEKRFVVYGDNELETRYLLTPDMQSRIVEANRDFPRTLRIVWKNGLLAVIMPGVNNPFTVKPGKFFDGKTHLDKLCRRLKTFSNLPHVLGMDVRIWDGEHSTRHEG